MWYNLASPENTALDKALSAATVLSERRILMKLEWGKEEVRYGRKEKQDEGFGTKLEAPIVIKCNGFLMDYIGLCFESPCELMEVHFEEEENIIYVLALNFH